MFFSRLLLAVFSFFVRAPAVVRSVHVWRRIVRRRNGGVRCVFSLFFHGGGLWPAYVPCVWASLDADPVSETARASVDRRAHARARRSGTWCLRSAHRSGRAWPSKKWAPGVGNVGRGVGFESERLG